MLTYNRLEETLQESPMIRAIASVLLALSLATVVSGCVVAEERRCAYGWEPRHRDHWGHWVGGHCRY
jgi:hypothetical protein